MKKAFLAILALMVMLPSNLAIAAPWPPEFAEAASRGRLLSLQSWTPVSANKTRLTCAVILPAGQNDPRASILVVYRGGERIFAFAPTQFPISLFILGRSANLAALWETGENSYVLTVFTFENGEVKTAFEDRSKLMPEFVYSTIPPEPAHSPEVKDPAAFWSERIIVTKMDWVHDSASGERVYEPLTADIYTWDGKHYQMQKGVKWSERLK
jgi:hypothetical protein